MNEGMNESVTGVWPSTDSRLSHPAPQLTETLPSCLLARSQSVNTEPDTQTLSAPWNAFNQDLCLLPSSRPRRNQRVCWEHVCFPVGAVVEHKPSGWYV